MAKLQARAAESGRGVEQTLTLTLVLSRRGRGLPAPQTLIFSLRFTPFGITMALSRPHKAMRMAMASVQGMGGFQTRPYSMRGVAIHFRSNGMCRGYAKVSSAGGSCKGRGGEKETSPSRLRPS